MPLFNLRLLIFQFNVLLLFALYYANSVLLFDMRISFLILMIMIIIIIITINIVGSTHPLPL